VLTYRKRFSRAGLARVRATILQLLPPPDVNSCHALSSTDKAARRVPFAHNVELIAVMFVLLILALATLPMWPYSTNWTYFPACGCGLAVTVIVLLALGGRI